LNIENDFENIQFNIIYSPRKTLSLEIKPDGFTIRAPKGIPRREINNFVKSKQSWIKKQLSKIQARQEALEQFPVFTMDEIRGLADKALVVIPEKVKKYAPIVGVDYGKITIRNQRSRWGSCSSKGNLNFNCLLMLFSDEVIDYVVVHELCHRKHMNHSAAFYEEVERVFPEYRKYQKWLKENGGLYLNRLP
jgi:predicted metal-dependent hydrolase